MLQSTEQQTDREGERGRERETHRAKERERLFEVRMRAETVSATALGSTGFRYLYSVCFFRLFGPTGL